MAAYAAVVSLINNIHQIKNNRRLSASLDKEQIVWLGEKVGFLLDFIESCNSHGAEGLESRIASVAHAAEDVIESHILDRIHVGASKNNLKFFLGLEKVTEDVGSISEEVTKFIEERGLKDQQPTYSTPAVSSRPLTTGKTTMVGFDDNLIQLLDKLTGLQSQLQVIPIVGMGGIGKTTLTINAFENALIMQYFDIRAWVTVSQNYSVRDIFLELLSNQAERSESLLALDQHQLGEKLYKYLWGRRYLIILDDIWGIEAWDNIKFSFPDNKNGSRIVVTSRLTEMGLHFGSSYLTIYFLDEDQSWKLFCEKAFGQEDCPIELEDVGKKISKNCRGLPLSIVVIGGFLQKSNKSQEFWESVAKDTNSILNSEGEEQCMDILSLSYSHLPAHLKPCFLYMGVFPEDDEIHASRLINLWVGEGFVKANESQSLEEIADDNLKDLVERNLILVCRWGSDGTIKTCNIHDILRALCLKVGKKEKFLSVLSDTPGAINRERRLVIDGSVSHKKVYRSMKSASHARSLISKGHRRLDHQRFDNRLLRVVTAVDKEKGDGDFIEADFKCVNLRCLDRRLGRHFDEWILACHYDLPCLKLPKKISLFWNLETISIRGCQARIFAPPEIWELRQLRHLMVDVLNLPDPPPGDLVLQNLHTLGRAENFMLSAEVCKRIPNIKKLHLICSKSQWECEVSSYYCPHNLGQFYKLESLNFYFIEKSYSRDLLLNITFQSSLQKLILSYGNIYWEDLSMFGSLPHLKVLKLDYGPVNGSEWNPVEGEFRSLKFLKIYFCYSLTKWNADSCHFPVLEKLILGGLINLDEIPLSIGEIPTLRFIHVISCSVSCSLSAVKILEEQECQGNEELQVEVKYHVHHNRDADIFREKVEERGFKSNNMHVTRGWYQRRMEHRFMGGTDRPRDFQKK